MGRPIILDELTLQALLAAGKTNEEIMECTGMGLRTVQTRIQQLRKKPSGKTSLMVRDAMQREKTQIMAVVEAIPHDPSAEYLHRVARVALAQAAVMDPGSRDSMAAAAIILDKVLIAPKADAKPQLRERLVWSAIK